MRKATEEEQLFAIVKREIITKVDEDDILKLRQLVRSVQTWFFDLDDNHAPSPAKQIVKKAIGTSHFSPKYLQWCASTALQLAWRGKAAESAAWKDYVNVFLRNEKTLAEVQKLFTPEYSRQSLYPGVEEFCGLVSKAQRFYVTRNIAEVVSAYASALKFNGFFPESDHKEKVVEDYLKKHPLIQRYGVEGDSEEDGTMIEVLQFYEKDVLSFYSMVNPKVGNQNIRFEYVIPKDRTGLVKILQE